MSVSSKLQSPYLDPEAVDRINKLELFVRGAVEGGRIGMHRSSLHGLSTEFTHHRPYAAGDEVKHVDWKVYSKTDRYYIKQFEAETNFDAYLLFDASSSMHFGSGDMSKLEYAKHLAAVLAYLVVEQGDSVGLATFDDALREYVRPRGSKSVIADISRVLEGTRGEPRTNVAAIMNEFASRIRRRGFVILFSDLFDHEDAFIDAMNLMRFKGQHIIVFHLMDPEELTFPFGGTVKFAGLEGEDELKVQPDRLRADYLEEVELLKTKINKACRAVNADYVLVDTGRPIQDVLVEYLNTRKALHWHR
jgi:uncharacterized protein (DUF58 family)